MGEGYERLVQGLWLSTLIRQGGLNARNLRRAFYAWPDPEQIMTASPLDLADQISATPEKIGRILSLLRDRTWLPQITDAARAAEKMGIWAVFQHDAGFPVKLLQISCCPLVLFCRGRRLEEMSIDQNGNNRFGVTVIGTRNPTPYGRAVTEMITADLADHQVMIISGMARGIDSIAHRTALKRHGLTIAVLGNGPDLPYPPENADLLQEISRKGLIISEHPPGTAPRKQHFPARNRILSGLSDAIAVIEASRDSGSLITANFAGDQGRDVYAVPGSILSPFSQGCNQLIREGAEILCSASDILQRLPVGVMQQELACRVSQYADHPDMIMNHDLFHALVGGPLSLAELTGILEKSVAETAALLTRQELDGYISCEKGRYSLTAQGKICI